jgi:hypothetical protein
MIGHLCTRHMRQRAMRQEVATVDAASHRIKNCCIVAILLGKGRLFVKIR